MLKRKKVVSLLMASTLVLSATGCGKETTTDNEQPTPTVTTAPEETPTPEPTEAPATPTPEPTKAPATPTPAPSYEAGYVADFEDGNFSFVAIKETMANSADTALSVVDFGGSKMLLADAPDASKLPYVAIDISSLAGDAIANVRSIEMDLGVMGGDGKFYSVAGNWYVYTGEDNAEDKSASWSVYLESKNPKRVTYKLADDKSFAAGAKNIIMMVPKNDDNNNAAVAAGSYAQLYFDNIVLKDADGNAIALNTAAEFNAPDGFADADWSNLVQVKNEVSIEGMASTSGGSWWPATGMTTDAANADAHYVDPAVFGPGKIMTVYFTMPEGLDAWQQNLKMVAQYFPVEGSTVTAPAWTAFENGGDGISLAVNDDGSMMLSFDPLATNDSKTTAQFSYDAIAAHLGDDWFNYVSFLGFADYGYALTITEVTVGEEKKVLPATVKDVAIEGFAVKGDAWTQAGVARVADGGTFDASLLKPGSVVTINYASEGNVWLVAVPAEGASFGWSRICQGTATKNDDNTACQITYEEIVAALGTDDLSQIAQLQCEGDAAWEVYSVTVGEYAPEPLKYTNEVVIEGSACTGTAWGQNGVTSVASGGTFDTSLLVPGSVVNVAYADNGANFWLVFVPADGAPYAWSRVCQDTARMCPTKGIFQVTYDEIVAALGTEDFSTLYALQVESAADWEIYSISIATLAE